MSERPIEIDMKGSVCMCVHAFIFPPPLSPLYLAPPSHNLQKHAPEDVVAPLLEPLSVYRYLLRGALEDGASVRAVGLHQGQDRLLRLLFMLFVWCLGEKGRLISQPLGAETEGGLKPAYPTHMHK